MARFFKSNLGDAQRWHQRAARNALTAAATVVQNQAKRNVRGGFKSGQFVTGNLMNKIAIRVSVTDTVAEAVIGTTVDYGAFWELGHHNTFTGKYEREEWLRPALEKTMKKQQAAAVLAVARTPVRGV